MAPFFAQGRGLETADITLLMAVFVLGGTLSQLPLGWASGQIDLRIVILIVAFGAVITGLVIGLDIFPSSLITFVVSACRCRA